MSGSQRPVTNWSDSPGSGSDRAVGRLTKRKNRNVAVVATARKLVTIAWHMLRNNEPYRYAQPRSTESKLARLRVQATGKRKRGGTPRGMPRPAHYGQKLGRPVPSLDAVYAGEQLPLVREAAPGEQRMIADQALTHFVDALHQPARMLKKSGGAAS